jgi:selenocysteine lyase/cysteine desulfurase
MSNFLPDFQLFNDDRQAVAESLFTALLHYSNVHRGNGQFSQVSTALYEHARAVVLKTLGFDAKQHVVIFSSAWHADLLTAQLSAGEYWVISSRSLGLPFGLRAVVVRRDCLPGSAPTVSGGGTVKMVSPDVVIWEDTPERFEAGTPAVLHAVALARGLQLAQAGHKKSESGLQSGSATARQILYDDPPLDLGGRELLERLRDLFHVNIAHVPIESGQTTFIQMDHAASTPAFQPVWQAARAAWELPVDEQQALIKEVQGICLRFLGADNPQSSLIFTSNATEAINLAVRLIPVKQNNEEKGVVINTMLEHNSNELPWRLNQGIELLTLPVDDDGFMDLEKLELWLKEYNQLNRHAGQRIRLVTVCGASNVVGSYNDLTRISQIVHAYGARLLVDAAQMAAHRKIDMQATGIDYLVLSGHKMYAPFGCGLLVSLHNDWNVDAQELENITNSGEENTAGIAALGKAMLLLQHVGFDVIQAVEEELTTALIRTLHSIDGVKVYGVDDPHDARFRHRGGVVSFSMRSTPRNVAADELAELAGIGVRGGCFCAHLFSKQIMHIAHFRSRLAEFGLHVLPNFTMRILPGMIRVSIGLDNTLAEIDRLGIALRQINQRPRTWLERLAAMTLNATIRQKTSQTGQQIAKFVQIVQMKVFGDV